MDIYRRNSTIVLYSNIPYNQFMVMVELNKEMYINSSSWRESDLLVNPYTVSKRCACCQKLRFTIDFIDSPGFVDWKIPICLTCFKSNSLYRRSKMVEILEFYGIKKKCSGCKKELCLLEFGYDKLTFGLRGICKKCNSYEAKEERA